MARKDPPIYTFMGKEYPIVIEIPQAFTFKAEFGVNLLKIFEGDNMNELTVTLALDDEKIIEIWWWFIGKKMGSDAQARENAIDKLTRESLNEFKEALWAAIVNFSDPAMKPALIELKQRLPELLKKQISRLMDELENESSQQNQNS